MADLWTQKLKSTLQERCGLEPESLIGAIISDSVAYVDEFDHPNLAVVMREDWERVCEMKAFDHVYVEVADSEAEEDEFQQPVYNVRISRGTWDV